MASDAPMKFTAGSLEEGQLTVSYTLTKNAAVALLHQLQAAKFSYDSTDEWGERKLALDLDLDDHAVRIVFFPGEKQAMIQELQRVVDRYLGPKIANLQAVLKETGAA